jgi:hypothetical protein
MHREISGGVHKQAYSSVRRNVRRLLLTIALTVCVPALAQDRNPLRSDDGYVVTYQTDWANGIDPRLDRHAPNQDAIKVMFVPEFNRTALMTTIRIQDDFTAVANGSARAELTFSRAALFKMRNDYEIRWSTMIPRDFQFDSKQLEIVTQIHQSSATGSPPFSLLLADGQYLVEVRGRKSVKRFSLGDARADRGKVVSWLLRYRPDDTGATAVTDLYKDDNLAVKARSVENAYPNDESAYLKIGVYKWDWKPSHTNLDVRTMYYGDVQIRSRPQH